MKRIIFDFDVLEEGGPYVVLMEIEDGDDDVASFIVAEFQPADMSYSASNDAYYKARAEAARLRAQFANAKELGKES